MITDKEEVKKTTTSKWKQFVPALLSLLIVLGFFVLLWGLLSGNLKADESQALYILLGTLATAFVQVMNYWFGTTIGSSQKTDIIAKSVPIETTK